MAETTGELLPATADADGLPAPLTADEADDLAGLEGVIDRCRRSFEAAGLALRDIRDRRLYRAEFRSFEAYCKYRWNLGKVHPYRLIAAAEVVLELRDSPAVTAPPPATEALARELTLLPTADLRAEVWGRAVASANGTPLTARRVREVALEVCPPPPPPDPTTDPDHDAADPQAELTAARNHRQAVALVGALDNILRRLARLRPDRSDAALRRVGVPEAGGLVAAARAYLQLVGG